ncbi:PIG-F family protein [Aspergillus ruber CBS 135680]|uniref:Glycosylphosphatidylinositol anchor biosynthesis protein 11 n=1 Tax=Aspergillus ruber (strain CBS 135680) TaxID=1388766 RepID=A0A017S2R4_ASPRC|nr:uncharacterized protein EURHEDRAFT_465102 [Aspergillus ruber CBS 135680]EYE91328.1 hypothetical protein EURHEDRAFT_465102 [Aspergillus ruber CBS 135680]
MTSAPPSPPHRTGTSSSSSSNPTQSQSNASASAQAPPPKPPAPAVSILPGQLARVYSFAHPVLLLGLLAVRFKKFVEDPVSELFGDLPVLAGLQVLYAVVCLPPAGAPSSKGTTVESSLGGSEGTVLKPGRIGLRRKHAKEAGISVKVVPALISLTLTTLLATPILSILLVLFGAPLTTHNLETLLCAAHMAVLSATALVYVHGVDGSTWREVWGVGRPADAVWGGALGTGVGAWFGAVPIPLDWDRPWQAYPITILTGAYIGYALGSLISRSSCLYGKRIQFTPEVEEDMDKKTE